MESIPDNAEVKELLADYTKREEARMAVEQKRREAELVEQRAREKNEELHTAFNILLRGVSDSGKFEEHELVSTKTLGETGTAIKEAFTGGQPSFQIVRFEQPRSDIFALQVRQTVSLGYRDCFVAGSQVREGETRILFKVLEYDHPPKVSLLGGLITAVITAQVGNDATRAAKFQEQVNEGAPMVKERLEGALK